MNIDDIREIAEGVFPDNNGWCGDKLAIPIQGVSGLDFDFCTFNPYESKSDAFLVLDDLVNKNKTLGVELINQGGGDYSVDVNSVFNGYVRADEQDLKHAICEAWLSLHTNIKG